MTETSETAAATFCATLVDEWVRCGVTDAVVAPGSRSTPLALALAAEERIRLHVHHDERSAAFVALGLGMSTGRPAPVLTTSGTATVELHPAVVEAHHSRVPMICCTADRPPELRHVAAPQTIDQTRLYGPVVRWFVDPGVPDDAARSSWRSLAARAVAESSGPPAGPVQLNLPFRDPLVGRPGELPAARDGDAPWHRRTVVGGRDDATVQELASVVAGARGVIVAGGGPVGHRAEPEAVHDLARALGWPVLADPRSGCRIPAGTTVSHADALLRHERFARDADPDVVIRLGEPPASKVQSQWLDASGALTVVVDPDGAFLDPGRVAARVVATDPTDLCRDLAVRLRSDGDAADEAWISMWAAADAAASTAIGLALAAHREPTEPAVARDLFAALPDRSRLVVSSSMPVRDLEWYGEPRRGVEVLANRGANGIDGVVSTAVGVALGGAPTALLVGDVAMLHDTNGLLGLARRHADLLVVVVDNDGGGIFSFLPQATQLTASRFEQLFGTPHGVDLAGLVAAHDLPVSMVERQSDLGAAVREAMSSPGSRVLIVRTERDANVGVHDEIHAAVAAAIDRA